MRSATAVVGCGAAGAQMGVRAGSAGDRCGACPRMGRLVPRGVRIGVVALDPRRSRARAEARGRARVPPRGTVRRFGCRPRRCRQGGPRHRPRFARGAPDGAGRRNRLARGEREVDRLGDRSRRGGCDRRRVGDGLRRRRIGRLRRHHRRGWSFDGCRTRRCTGVDRRAHHSRTRSRGRKRWVGDHRRRCGGRQRGQGCVREDLIRRR